MYVLCVGIIDSDAALAGNVLVNSDIMIVGPESLFQLPRSSRQT